MSPHGSISLYTHLKNCLTGLLILFILLPIYIFCADRCANRGDRSCLSNSSWSRNWSFTIPVLDFAFWTSPEVINSLSNALAFMTGDRSFEFHFTKATHEPLKTEEYQTSLFSNQDLNIQRGKNMDVMLFSGGLDSLAGAIDRLNTYPDRQLCLINHMKLKLIK